MILPVNERRKLNLPVSAIAKLLMHCLPAERERGAASPRTSSGRSRAARGSADLSRTRLGAPPAYRRHGRAAHGTSREPTRIVRASCCHQTMVWARLRREDTATYEPPTHCHDQ